MLVATPQSERRKKILCAVQEIFLRRPPLASSPGILLQDALFLGGELLPVLVSAVEGLAAGGDVEGGCHALEGALRDGWRGGAVQDDVAQHGTLLECRATNLLQRCRQFYVSQ